MKILMRRSVVYAAASLALLAFPAICTAQFLSAACGTGTPNPITQLGGPPATYFLFSIDLSGSGAGGFPITYTMTTSANAPFPAFPGDDYFWKITVFKNGSFLFSTGPDRGVPDLSAIGSVPAMSETVPSVAPSTTFPPVAALAVGDMLDFTFSLVIIDPPTGLQVGGFGATCSSILDVTGSSQSDPVLKVLPATCQQTLVLPPSSLVLGIIPGLSCFTLSPLMVQANQHLCLIGEECPCWFYEPPSDPPIGFRYIMTSDSLFTAIQDFPTGFAKPFTVTSRRIRLGSFAPGQSVVFPDGGVSEFTVLGITAADPANYIGFPLRPRFNTTTTTSTFVTVALGGVAGDVNADGKVTCDDLAIVKASFGKRAGQAGFDYRADIDDNGVVDIRDFLFVLLHLPPGTTCPFTVPPS